MRGLLRSAIFIGREHPIAWNLDLSHNPIRG